MRFSNKKLFGVATIALSTLAAVGVVGASNGAFAGILATSTATGKHYAAVMPTATTQGIREYWTDCVGGNPVFTEPAYPVTDANLTAAQVQAILADPADERIIPTLDRIQAAVTKGVDGTKAYDYTFVYDAYAYTYLDATTKAQITGANVEVIEDAVVEWQKYFTVVYDVAKDPLPGKDQAFVSFARGYDATYGDVLEISTTEGSAGGTSQLYFYGLNTHGVTYGANDVLNFSVYSPFPAAASTSQTYWVDNYGTAKRFTANPNAWTEIAATGTELNSNGAVATAFNGAISLQRYVNGTIDPYSGTYKMTSIIAEKELVEDGLTVIRGKNAITDVHTWGATVTDAVITYGVKTECGTATKVDIKTKTSVLELQWTGLKISNLKNYKYARMYVYAKTTQRVFVSLTNWRSSTASLFGVDPLGNDNKAKSDAVQSIANVVADQWNYIDIPTEYFAKDTDGKFFVEIWADKNEAKDGWLFTDFVGHNQAAVVDNGGLLIQHNSSASTSVAYDGDMGVCSRVTLAAADGYAKQNRATDISGFGELSFMVKNEAATNMSVMIYIIASGAYGKQGTGKDYFTKQVLPGQTEVIKVDIADYFGTYAATSSIMFKVSGAAGNTMLFSCIEAK